MSQKLKEAFIAEAHRLGFFAVGVSKAVQLQQEARHLEQWLQEGRNAGMGYMENHFDKRIDPRKLVEGATTVISLLHSYLQPQKHDLNPQIGKISRYAWGDDYHEVLKEKLAELYFWLDHECKGISGRVFVDSAPVMDKVWATKSGLGWIGKNGNLLNRKAGSFFFIAELIVDVQLPEDAPTTDHCGTCTRCLEACPTQAIYAPKIVDANKCISYWTIEHKGGIPRAVGKDFENWIFGCDVCQDVCPWNKFGQLTTESRFLPRESIENTLLAQWVALDIEEFRQKFRKNPVKRAKFEGFIRNVENARRNTEISNWETKE